MALFQQSGTATECSVSSKDIERQYQQNRTDGMIFKVKGQSYKLDFGGCAQFLILLYFTAPLCPDQLLIIRKETI